jgi:putative chitinase
LNYSVAGLRSVFPKYFPTIELATAYARKPMQIANRVYASRMGNGDEKSGDGWKYHGRGIIQLTGKTNYQKFADYLKKPLADTVSFCSTFSGFVESAMYFWKTNNCNTIADKEDFIKLTKVINGGTNGLEDRNKNLKRLQDITSSWIVW